MPVNRKQLLVNRISIPFCIKRSILRTSLCLALKIQKSVLLPFLQLMTNVLVQCVIDRKLPRQTLLVAYPGRCEAFSNSPQSDTLRRNVLLPFDVRPSDDQCEAVECRVAEFVVLQNGLKRTALPSMIQLHFGKPRRVEGDRLLPARCFQKLVFGNKEEFRVGVDKSSDEPWTGHPVHFDVAARNPLHR